VSRPPILQTAGGRCNFNIQCLDSSARDGWTPELQLLFANRLGWILCRGFFLANSARRTVTGRLLLYLLKLDDHTRPARMFHDSKSSTRLGREFRRLSEHHDVTYCYVTLCFDIDFILDDMDRERCKVLFSPAHCLHSLLPPVKSNPYGLRSRDHDLQLPVCNNFSRRLSLLLYVVFLDLNTILLCLYSFLTAIFLFLRML